MNQTFRENAKNNIKKDFFKLMNNANFGFDCRNNAYNTKFEPIIHEMNNLFDDKVSKFLRSEILEQQINQRVRAEIAKFWEDDQFRNARLREIENEKNAKLDGL